MSNNDRIIKKVISVLGRLEDSVHSVRLAFPSYEPILKIVASLKGRDSLDEIVLQETCTLLKDITDGFPLTMFYTSNSKKIFS